MSLAGLIADLGQVAAVDPGLVESELRPVVERLAARVRTCSSCGTTYLQKRTHLRPRYFCSARACVSVSKRRRRGKMAEVAAAIDHAEPAVVPLTT